MINKLAPAERRVEASLSQNLVVELSLARHDLDGAIERLHSLCSADGVWNGTVPAEMPPLSSTVHYLTAKIMRLEATLLRFKQRDLDEAISTVAVAQAAVQQLVAGIITLTRTADEPVDKLDISYQLYSNRRLDDTSVGA